VRGFSRTAPSGLRIVAWWRRAPRGTRTSPRSSGARRC
jgi:hypothetical protein